MYFTYMLSAMIDKRIVSKNKSFDESMMNA